MRSSLLTFKLAESQSAEKSQQVLSTVLCQFLPGLVQTSKVTLYIEEARRLGIKLLNPDVNYSYENFIVEDGKIRFGLKAIKGVGTNFIQAIVQARKEGGPFTNLRNFFEP